MIKPINRDPVSLSKKSSPASILDAPVGRDLLDTLTAHADGCVGMAANMIGVYKNIIAVDNNGTYMLMYNPEIISRFGPYEAEEGCLSLPGQRRTTRYRTIRVRYQDISFKKCEESFSGFTAQIIQHEVDHCNGILI